MDALNGLYDKVTLGRYVIVDDYNIYTGCKHPNGISEPTLHRIRTHPD